MNQDGTVLELETDRLRLLALTHQQLDSYLMRVELLEAELGIPLSRDIDEAVRTAMLVKGMRMVFEPLQLHAWLTYWLVIIKEVQFGAGLIGFKGAPDNEGCVEIGYGIDPAYRRQGYTSEAASALIGWAFAQPDCRAVTAEILPENTASMRVAQKVGMHLIQHQEPYDYWRIDRPQNFNIPEE